MQSIRNSRLSLWIALALPGAVMMLDLRGGALIMDQVEPSGRWAVWLMLVALSIGPLLDLFGPRAFMRWLVRMRRSFGVAAFGYALLHLAFYAVDLGSVADMIAEFDIASIWTGWLSLALMAIPALLSNETSVQALGAFWKRLQRLVYAVAALALVHWALLSADYGIALLTFAPFLILSVLRFIQKTKRKAMI